MSLRSAIDDFRDTIPSIGAARFTGLYWALAEESFFWHNPPSGAGVIHHGNGEITIEEPSERQWLLLKRILVINGCIDALFSVLSKIEFITTLWQGQNINDDTWFRYVQTDIHSFHTELRSLFDSIALLLKNLVCVGDAKGTDSFNFYRDQLSLWSKKTKRRELLPPAYWQAIAHCDWFDQLRTMRDFIMHNERDAWVLWRADGHIMFKMTFAERLEKSGLHHNVCLKHFLWNDCILFRPYAGYYVGRTIAFLNRLSKLFAEDVNLELNMSMRWSPTLSATAMTYVLEAYSILEPLTKTSQQNFSDNWERVFQ